MAKIRESQFAMDFGRFVAHQKSLMKGRGHIPDHYHSKEGLLIRHILWRRRLNMNTLVLIVGGVRTGKSVAGLQICKRYCETIKKPFDVEKQCSFEPIEYLKWAQTNTDSAYFLDEMGVSVSPQNWFTVQSKIFNTYCQIGGFRKNLLVMATPSVAYLLKSVRFLINYMVEMYSQGRGVVCKVKMIHRFGKGYLPSLGGFHCTLPSKKITVPYERMKQRWNDKKLQTDIKALEMETEKQIAKYQQFQETPAEYRPFERKIV